MATWTTNWLGSDSTGGTIQFSNGTADQLWIYQDTANTATTAGTYTDTGTAATNGYISWPDNLMGGSIQGVGVGNQTIRTNIHIEPEAQLNIRAAQPGELSVDVGQWPVGQPRTQGPDEAPVAQRIITNTARNIATIPPGDERQAIANERGQDLLKEIVGDVMYRRYQKQGWIDIRSADKPDIMYRIQPWREIALLERNAKKEWVSNQQSICIHARETHVEGDEVAAHVMLCRYDEKLLWKMGNLHGVRRAA